MKKFLTPLILGTALALPAFGAASAADDTLTIGVATAQTGSLAPFDGPVIEGFKIAVDEINEAGGIDGKIKIETIDKDVRSDAAQTSIATQELVDAGVDVLVLPCDADPAFAAASISGAAQIPAFSTCASSPTLPVMGGDYMFANFPGDNVQATVSAKWAFDQGHRSAYLLYSPDTQYTTLPLYFGDVFEALGGKILGKATYKLDQQDFSAEVTKIKALDPQPDVIMTSAYEPNFPAFIKQLRAAGVRSQVIGSDGIDSPTTFSLGEAAEGVVFSTAGHPTAGSPLEKFNKLYEEKMGKKSETVFNAIGYDLVKVIAAAVKEAGTTDSVALRDAIANLENVQGATSLITYKGTMGMPVREVSLVRVKDGKRELVGQPSPDADLIPAPRMQ
ncbi:branched-chain amino acid transport system substrate-binding protein [Rhodobium orientis]|uniref:ABC transporter substrate-binding protein n=1 Tax=Rhodobium orientis TaxID=34017 RepID=A0A327JW65_9HYPH|nr:ABC transporter substrate-binding protein [Rhodobium orientis]MBB4302555.1 branched-chain amino acid transport system substrate-binding protein [Rhodobium orientis]MBK5949404.1 ABC transporter substrate-binding protein [Rhodobium orientis]RAI29162.1 ABC transporter substrate-binding protein [Rhodobium orientis]